MKMPVITLWNPWAIWIAKGWKTIETRTHERFRILTGQTIGIHAGLKWDNDAITSARDYLTPEQIEQTQRFLRVGGAIICTAKVVSYRRLNGNDSQKALLDCANTVRCGLFLDDVKVIEMIPAEGRQGIWYYDDCEIDKT